MAAWFRQNKGILMMTKVWFTKIVYFMTTGARGSCARPWLYKSYSENTLFL